MGEERLGAVDDAPEVDVHQPLEVVDGLCGSGRTECHAGVVGDQVDLAVVGGDRVGPGEDRVTIGDVESGRAHRHPGPLAAEHRLGESLLVDVAEREVAAASRQFLGQCLSDAGAGTGDCCDVAR